MDPENPIELAFQKRYGLIVTYKWYLSTNDKNNFNELIYYADIL